MFRGIYSFFFKRESTILCLTKFKNALITWKKGYPARSKDLRKSAQNPGENKHTLPSDDPQNLPFHRKPGLWANISCKITGFSCVTQDLYKDYFIYLQSKVWVKSLKKVFSTFYADLSVSSQTWYVLLEKCTAVSHEFREFAGFRNPNENLGHFFTLPWGCSTCFEGWFRCPTFGMALGNILLQEVQVHNVLVGNRALFVTFPYREMTWKHMNTNGCFHFYVKQRNWRVGWISWLSWLSPKNLENSLLPWKLPKHQ